MRSIWSSIATILVLFALLLPACGGQGADGDAVGNESGQGARDPAADEATVRSVVEAFGRQLQKVPLLAPEDILRETMKEQYSDYVTPELLAAWQADPANAPGRAVSSPWPDRIEIGAVERLTEDAYQVEGKIIEVTSVELGTDEAAATRPISLVVRWFDDRWLIDEVTVGDYDSAGGTA